MKKKTQKKKNGHSTTTGVINSTSVGLRLPTARQFPFHVMVVRKTVHSDTGTFINRIENCKNNNKGHVYITDNYNNIKQQQQ